jgi:peptidyl-prolyl cis-trans isomerase A (cyclophilin A)
MVDRCGHLEFLGGKNTGYIKEMKNNIRSFAKRLTGAGLLILGTAGLAAQAGNAPTLKDPSTLTEMAPDKFKVKFETTKGDFVVEVDKSWSPRGAHRFYNLVKNGFYNDVRFFRVLPGIAQFGIHGDPAISRVWRGAAIVDDAPKQSNERGYLTYAAGGPNSRTTQIFINRTDNKPLDASGFAPFGRITSGLNVIEELHGGYANNVDQNKAFAEGNAYLTKSFPKLDYIKTATIVE